MYAFEKGDKFENIDLSLKGKHILLVFPNIHISTQEAYRGVIPAKPDISIKEILRGEIKSWKDQLTNDFEKSIFPKYPVIKEIKDKLYSQNALYASMSGSGSTVFGIFDNEIPEISWPAEFKIRKAILW
jgi:4-diphosphocytidyl-2-C-methyl-D-erythritol kinase